MELQKQQEVFFNGLDPITKLELSKYLKKDFKCIYESIIITEGMLIENIQHAVFKEKGNNSNQDNYNDKTHHTNQNKIPNKKIIKKKYCTFHQSRTHNDEECWTKNKANKPDNNKKSEKLLSLQEPLPELKTILIPVTYHNKQYNAILDTGLEYNYVSEKTVEICNNSLIKNIPSKPIELANGSITHVSKTIKDEIQIFNDEKMRIRYKLFVLKKLLYPFLFGIEFILKNNAILNIQNKTITIDGMEYELDMSKKSLTKYDEQLI
ncbi:hypothetical protein DMUE_0218 [Dictyocoela muelleri]|nr:hypothetical protein DMUE_0218 [Dictyocoela muelleri]